MRFTFNTGTWKRCLVLLATLLLTSADVTAQPACPAGCVCSDDGLSAVCSDLGEKLPPDLAGSFISLDLSDHGLLAIDASTFANLPLLEQLDVSRGRIAQVSSDAFRALRNLRRLILSDNLLTSLPEDAFPDSLNELRLAGNPLSLPASGPFLSAFGLSRLDLSRCSVSDVGVDAFSQLPSLVELDLRGNRLAQLSPVAFTGLERLYVDEGTLGSSAVAVSQVVSYVVETARTVPSLSQAGSQTILYDEHQDGGSYTDGGLDLDKNRNDFFKWPSQDNGYEDLSPLFGPGSRDVADSSLFKGAPFQATGEVTVVYASDLQNLKETLLVLVGLVVLCFMLAALHRAVETLRGRQHAWQDVFSGRSDNYWWDAEHVWLEMDKPDLRASELPPAYPHPPSYEDSMAAWQPPERGVGVQPAVHRQAGSAPRHSADSHGEQI